MILRCVSLQRKMQLKASFHRLTDKPETLEAKSHNEYPLSMAAHCTTEPLMRTFLPLSGRRQGKVRDIYDAKTRGGDDVLLIVATDRISAFDVVMPNGVGGKGVVLTQISRFWFDRLAQHFGDAVRHHLISTDPAEVAGLDDSHVDALRGRVMIGRRCRVVPVECVVRGYLAGSAWAEYRRGGTICGIELPKGLRRCERLPEPIFTPATKADAGHDENISFQCACDIAGASTMAQLRDLSLAIYRMGHDYAAQRGILLADTKFEFGLPLDGGGDSPILIDELLTPDSSRFWPADQFEIGRDQPNFDKQYVRNYLQELVDSGRWEKMAPGPQLPAEIVSNTRERYLEAYRRLTGEDLHL